MRLIDADALFPDGVDETGIPVLEDDEFIITLGKLRRYIRKQPTVDPVKHGHWIIEDHYLDGGDIVRRLGKCSCCNNLCGEGKYAYCPHCGAKMDEVIT